MKVVEDNASLREQNVAQVEGIVKKGVFIVEGKSVELICFICEILFFKNICLRAKWKFLTWEYCGGE